MNSILALNCDSLYAKSQVYIKRGFRAQATGEKEEYQLWASLALELLGKAALANVHPALIADPTHFQSIFAACGKVLSPDTKTITAKTLFERLSHLDKLFDKRHQTFCEQLSLRRNAELHSGESPFSGVLTDQWEAEFWGTVHIILSLQNETLESWLGVEDASSPSRILQQARQALTWAVRNRISRCREAFLKQHTDPKRRSEVLKESVRYKWNEYIWDKVDRQKCPACESIGFVGGTLWNEKIEESESGYFDFDDDEDHQYHSPTEIVRRSYTVESFHCEVCNLNLNGVIEVEEGGIDAEFQTEEERERHFTDDYGNE